MTSRRKIIVGNWKMNGRLTAGLTLAKDIVDKSLAAAPLPFDIVVCPPATLIWPVSEVLMETPVKLGAQNCHFANHGAYTGDVSAGMLSDLGCRYVLLGHSERRQGHGEKSEEIAKCVAAAQLADLTVVLCVGETKDEKVTGRTNQVIEEQIKASLPEKFEASKLVIGYEPVWAIGSGEQPNVDDIERVHRVIRKALGPAGEIVRVIYGGSVAPSNAAPILASTEIDGVLVGSASLNADGFWAIAEKSK
jgi:triosephosphate isomerase